MNVLANALQHHFARLVLAQSWIQVVALDNAQQIVCRHDSLADDLNALIGVTGNRRLHQVGRQFLLLDQNCSA